MAKQKNDVPTNVQTIANANLKKQICSFTILNDNMNYLKTISTVDGKVNFLRSFFISTVPRYLQFAKFLSPLYNFENIRTSIFIKPIETGETQSNLNSIISSLQMEKEEFEKDKLFEESDKTQLKIGDTEALRDEIGGNFNKLFEVSILSTIENNDISMLDIISESLGMTLSRDVINIRSCWGTQQAACKSNTPLNTDLLGNRSNIFDIFGTACIFPFISDTITHPKGIIFGFDKITNKIIYLDGFNTLLPNNNIVVLGSKNSQKYMALNLLTLRSSTCTNLKTIAIDTGSNFTNICDTLLGTEISLSQNTKIIINPFDIEPEIINDEITGRAKTFINIEEKSRELANLIISMSKSATPNSFPNKTTFDLAYTTILEEYKSIQITNSPDSLYTSGKTELVNNQIARIKKAMPTLGSWFRRICVKKTKNQIPELNNHFNYLIKYTKDFIKELNGKYSYFDGQTNISLSPNTAFINFDLAYLEKETLQPITQQVLLNWITEKFVKTSSSNSTTLKRRLIIDNCSQMLNYNDSCEILNNTLNKCKQKKISFAVVTDDYDSIIQNKNILNNLNSSGIKMILKHDKEDIEVVKKQFNLIEGEANFIEKCSSNEGILSAGTDSCQFHIDPIGYEETLI